MDDLSGVRFCYERLQDARGPRRGSDVARAIGISRQRLWAYENGEDAPPADVLVRLCLLYDLPIHYFSNISGLFLHNS